MGDYTKIAGHKLLTVSCMLMLLLALPMGWWTLNMVYSSAPHDLPGDGIATWGCIIGAAAYALSAPVAIFGLIFRKRPQKYGVCLVLNMIVAALLLVCAVMQRVYFLLTMLPLAVLIALNIIAIRALIRNRGRS